MEIAQYIMSQYGGPDGENRSLYALPCPSGIRCLYKMQKGLLTDIGTEELAHMEMIAAIGQQLTRNLTPAQNRATTGFGNATLISTTPRQSGRRQQAESRSMQCESQSKGDAITDLYEDMAAEQESPHNLRTIFSAWSKIRKYAIRSVFCASGDCTFSAVW